MFTCCSCLAIIREIKCPLCGHDHSVHSRPSLDEQHNGSYIAVPAIQLAGAIEWNIYILLEIMQGEWERPLIEEGDSHKRKIPQKLVIVGLFWSLFETLMDKFFSNAFRDLPPNISTDLMKRYSTVGSRINSLYKLAFSITLKEDLQTLGFLHIYQHLNSIQEKRNEFIHGHPEAIDQKTVDNTVHLLQETQFAWIQLYNKRCRKTT